RNGDADKSLITERFPDGRHQVLFDQVLCETNTLSVATAAVEMQAVALKNTRCKDPVYHFFLSWPETDSPTVEQIFESARHSLDALGMSEHQYVTAIHRDTDHLHCHVAVNRIHPVTYKVADDAYDISKLHKASREMELKYGWTRTHGCYVINDHHQVVRSYSHQKPMPIEAKKLEYYSDKESFYGYAVRECREEISKILGEKNLYWERLHAVLIRAGLELKKKDRGLAIYDRVHPEQTPLKASSLHPQLTLSKLVPRLGEFESAPRVMEFKNEQGEVTLTNYMVSSHYDDRLHLRDHQARMTRRLKRAEAREELKLRYQHDKKEAKCPSFDAKNRFRTLSMTFRFRRAHVCVAVRDPLLRKLAWHVLAFEREKAMAELRLKLKEERENWYRSPENRRLSYRVWVEQQALKGDKAAISQLRGWAYQAKRDERTAYLSDTVIECAVSDDIAPVELKGYTHHIHRDGVILYKKEGVTQMIDRGETIEMARPFENEGDNMVAGLRLAEQKSGEKRVFSGPREYVEKACSLVRDLNEMGETSLTLTDSLQQKRVCEIRPQDKPAPISFDSPNLTP
ncbi:TraI/MobA(P) family conjugative relaxase, partial [Candidatus Hamiltonella defensa]|uniref:TraI/MobA(P) family conjugative relaxase n=1 Tax=Candidatus Williamhamiltonella defendens TaxID=138072 RepID=UPI001584403B